MVTVIWGGIFIVPGLFVLVISIYLILTKKAASPQKLAWIAPFLTLILLGLGYAFIGIGWSDNVAASLDYFEKGAEEKVIILEEYKVDYPSGMYGGAIDYVYTGVDGEKLITNTDFNIQVFQNEKYEIRYLPRTKYIMGISHIKEENF
ncbi:hypothetical protein C2I06_22695 [Niallia circulans]|uniref:hypothetical protein n=2 Tax=Niallia TaxID=2837506 RepID=UPI000F448B3E|nr:hypothetical protein [Niallia circulans]AYV69426.1 hypothetical protein C2I06_22695 [Niallia circulans]